MEVIIDNRETKIKFHFQKSFNSIDIFKYENLDIGDIIIKYDNVIKYIFERKTIKDLSDSIKDNRYHEQKQRMLHALDSNIKICYIFESFRGYEGLTNNIEINNIKGNILLSAILNTTICNDFGTFTTYSINETIFIIEELIKRMLKNPDKYFNKTKQIDNSYLLKKRKKDNINRDNILVLYLSQIPGVSTSVGKTINNQFKTMNNLITFLNSLETKENKINYLSNIEVKIKNNKTRRIGEKIAIRIIELLF